jgi:hypothetical protein
VWVGGFWVGKALFPPGATWEQRRCEYGLYVRTGNMKVEGVPSETEAVQSVELRPSDVLMLPPNYALASAEEEGNCGIILLGINGPPEEFSPPE